MDERLTSDELRNLLGAFALGAVDADEREQVEQFVLDDRDARAELHQLEHAVAWLGHASPRPSAESWDAIRNEMQAELSTGAPSNVSQLRSPRGSEPTNSPAVMTGERTSHQGRGLWRRVTAVAAAAAIVVGVSVAVAEVIDSDSTTTTARATTIVLRAPDGAAAVKVRVAPDGTGTITASTLLAAPAGHVYQLWAQANLDAPMRSAGLLGRSPAAGGRVQVPDQSERVAISIEPDGGSAEPTTEPVAIATLGPV